MVELGHSFYPFPAYMNGWVGHRWREPNVEASRDWGNEMFFLAQVGANRGPWGIQIIAEGMESVTTPVFEGVRLPNGERQMLQLTPKFSYSVGAGAVSVGMRTPLSGQNLPAGSSRVLGYFRRW